MRDERNLEMTSISSEFWSDCWCISSIGLPFQLDSFHSPIGADLGSMLYQKR